MIALITRLGPLLTRAARATPGLLPRLGERLRAAGQTAIPASPRVADIVAWAKNNPGSLALLLINLASLGVFISQLVGDDSTPEEKALVEASSQASETATMNAVRAAGAGSELLRAATLDDPNTGAAIDTLRKVLAWARIHYGSADNAMKAHDMVQAFHEIPHEQVVWGYQNLKV